MFSCVQQLKPLYNIYIFPSKLSSENHLHALVVAPSLLQHHENPAHRMVWRCGQERLRRAKCCFKKRLPGAANGNDKSTNSSFDSRRSLSLKILTITDPIQSYHILHHPPLQHAVLIGPPTFPHDRLLSAILQSRHDLGVHWSFQ